MSRFDFVVLGSGPAGRRAAIQAAKLGKSVLVVDDRNKVGGVSVHTGTIPSKTLRETALNLSGWRERGFYGRSHRAKQDIGSADLSARMSRTCEHEVSILEHQFARNGVNTMVGRGRFDGPNRIIVDHSEDGRHFEEVIEAKKVLISVGTTPHRPKHIPFNDSNVLDSDDFISNPRLPRSLTVVGAGVIGIEYATIFSALDVPVTLIDPRERLLEFMDGEIIENLVHQMRDNGMSLRLGGMVDQIRLPPMATRCACCAMAVRCHRKWCCSQPAGPARRDRSIWIRLGWKPTAAAIWKLTGPASRPASLIFTQRVTWSAFPASHRYRWSKDGPPPAMPLAQHPLSKTSSIPTVSMLCRNCLLWACPNRTCAIAA